MDKLFDRIADDFVHWVLWMFTFLLLRYIVDYAMRLFGSGSNIFIDLILSFAAFVIASYIEILNEGKIKPIGKPGDPPPQPPPNVTIEVKK